MPFEELPNGTTYFCAACEVEKGQASVTGNPWHTCGKPMQPESISMQKIDKLCKANPADWEKEN